MIKNQQKFSFPEVLKKNFDQNPRHNKKCSEKSKIPEKFEKFEIKKRPDFINFKLQEFTDNGIKYLKVENSKIIEIKI